MATPAPRALAANRIAPRRALAGAVLCWAAFAIVALTVFTGAARHFDEAGLLLWRTGPGLMPPGPAWLSEAVRDISLLGGVPLRNLLALVAAAVLLFLRMRREAMLFAGTVIGAWVVDWLIKITVARPRPQLVPHLAQASGMSFPSGHSFNSAAIYIAMALAFAALSERTGVRRGLIGGAVALSMLVALSRIWLGVHYPTDVIAGWLGGAGWALFATALMNRETGP
ncbi:MAG: phosphatase PAP2 family protein [Sphingomonadales bacterium]|nr:phosphatase PAP2 family protein [Sphingomonadales bacterium]MDE2568649.1 phosphatase PAP2 family protein [Sphingomonadales bacterium]